MRRLLAVGLAAFLIGCLFTQVIAWDHPVQAAAPAPTPEPKKRIQLIDTGYTRYEWWLIRWSTNQVACQIFVDHPTMPTSTEIYKQCGKEIHEDWYDTKSCSKAGSEDGKLCQGMYLHMAGVDESQREVEVELPLPTVWLSLVNCNPDPLKHACTTFPSLLLEGEEPLPNETIIQIQGNVYGQPFTCPGWQCILPLKPTGSQGSLLEFWADSSLGDSTEHYTGLLRVVPWGDFANPDDENQDQQLWFADVLSSQWKGSGVDSCAASWQVFPDLGGAPEWLTTPENAADLQTSYTFYLLAGTLIKNGQVDVTGCDHGGLESGVIPNNCGAEKAREKVIEWQNLFDDEIMNVARSTGIPAFLIKSIFSRESQFWPGLLSVEDEVGFGQLTEKGADTVLLWNPEFFAQFCPLVLDQSVCALGFGNLKKENQALLRGALFSKVNAECADCPAGIDLNKANYSIRVFAETLRANCEQTAQIIRNITNKPVSASVRSHISERIVERISDITEKSPAQASNYVDLWRYTIIDYNAGPGCLTNAMRKAKSSDGMLEWDKVASNLDPVCQAGLVYLEAVSNESMQAYFPTATPTSTAPVTQVPTATPTPGPSPTPTTFAGWASTPTPANDGGSNMNP